jgi:L-threonylcarbamoyladenylate synthase
MNDSISTQNINIQKMLSEAKTRLQQGEAIIIPTETVYGIAVDATNFIAVEKIYAAKNRKRDVPLQIMCKNLAHAKQFGIFNTKAEGLGKKYFPGAITIVVNKVEGCKLSENININNKTIGIRVPNHELLLELLNSLDFPLAATSANISGQPATVDYRSALEVLKPQGVNFGLDGGKCLFTVPSTVVDATDDSGDIKILRLGAIEII